MKKIASILLLSMLLFNWFGFRLLMNYLERKADIQLELQLDESSYDDAQLLSIKVPVTYLPYYNNSMIFERVDGQIEIKGVRYKYVKRRIYQDSLELLCIPNHEAMNLQKAENDFYKFVNDLQPEKKSGQHANSIKGMHLDSYIAGDILDGPIRSFSFSTTCAYYSCFIKCCHPPTAEQPPDHTRRLA